MNKLFLLLMSVVLVMALVSCAGDPVTIPLDGGSTVGAVTGKVLNKSGVGVEGVKITIGDLTALTNASGQFSVDKVMSGSRTVTPSKAGYFSFPKLRK